MNAQNIGIYHIRPIDRDTVWINIAVGAGTGEGGSFNKADLKTALAGKSGGELIWALDGFYRENF